MIKILYVTIPKDIIYNTLINEKRILVYTYFAFKWGLDDTVGFSCDSIVEWCGYKHNYNKNKTNDQITNILQQLIKLEYMKVKGNITHNNYNEAILSSNKFNPDSGFALIYIDEIDKIKDFKSYTIDINKMSSSIILLVLSYLRMNMLRRQKEYIGEKSNKPEFCFRHYVDIEKDIGLSSRYISRAIKILSELGIIEFKEMPRYKDNEDNWHTDVTLFTNRYKRIDNGESLDMDYNYQQELQWGVDYIKEKKFLSKKFIQNTETK